MIVKPTRIGICLMALCIALQGCVAPVATSSGPATAARKPAAAPSSNNFATIVGQVEPVAEGVCRAASGRRNCDFRVILDTRPGQPANAFQTVDGNGRPILVVNKSLLAQLQNADEIAFVLSHEAAHHIADHLPRQQQNTYAGAVVAGLAAAALGGSQAVITEAQQAGAFAGGRAYSKNFELEADTLGAQIAHLAGYDPVRGVAYFMRAPDPGDRFLGTHPPNTSRIDAVKAVMARY